MSRSQRLVPQTLTTMEACMKLAPARADQFWKAQERMGPVAASQPGFRAVIGGEIAHSEWSYFCGKFATPVDMDTWYDSKQHKPVMDMAHEAWFDAYYIRKWRLPEVGEELAGQIFCETAIVPEAPLDEDELERLFQEIKLGMAELDPTPFETLAGVFEDQPFQLIGPLEEFPQVAPVRYLVVSHWPSPEAARAWLDSPTMKQVASRGELTTHLMVQVNHEVYDRHSLSSDGSHRSWARPGA